MRWTAIVVAGLAACSSGNDLRLIVEPDAQSVVLIIDDGEQPRLRAQNISGDGTRFLEEIPLTDSLELRALIYSSPLDVVGLVEGEALLVPAGAEARGLAAPDTAFLRISGDWQAYPSPRESVAGLFIPTTNKKACLVGGGCFDDVPGLAMPVCRLPCPEPPKPAPPEAPSPPRFGTCPLGWQSTQIGEIGETDDNNYCEPWMGAEAPNCPAGEVAFPGDDSCSVPGPPCPGDGWPQMQDPADWFVDPAMAGGTGTKASPFGSLSVALAAAQEGDVIALRSGSYTNSPTFARGVRLVGACVEGVLWQGSGRLTIPSGVAVSISNVSISNIVTTVMEVRGTLELNNIRVDGGRGIFVAGSGILQANSVLLDSGSGTALSLQDQGQASVDRFMAKGATNLFTLTSAGTVLTASRAYGLETFTGIQVRGGRAELHQTVFEDSRGTAVFASGAEASLEMYDTVLRQYGAILGGGVDLRDDAQLILHRTAMFNAGNFASVFAEGSQITGEDLLVYRESSNAALVRGVGAINSGRINLQRVKIVRAGHIGAYAFGTDARLTLSDATIFEVRSNPATGSGSPGVRAEANGLVVVERLLVDSARGTGILIIEQGRVQGSDVLVKNTGTRLLGNAYGRGMEITGTGTTELERVQFIDNLSAGVFVSDNNSLAVLRDIEISGTSLSTCFEFSCQATLADGVSSLLKGQVFLTNAWIHDNDQYGLRSQGANDLFVDGGLIEGNAIGVQISDPDFDLGDINLRTLYRNNGTTILNLGE